MRSMHTAYEGLLDMPDQNQVQHRVTLNPACRVRAFSVTCASALKEQELQRRVTVTPDRRASSKLQPPAVAVHLKAISLWIRSSATSTMLGRSV
jgi:hypothetical protein